MSLAILFHFLCAQHVSDINISIIRSLRLCWWTTTSVVLFSVRCVLELWCGWFWVVFVLQASACKKASYSLVHCLEMCHTREERAAARWWLLCIAVRSNQEHYPTQNSWNPCFLACNMPHVHGAAEQRIIQWMTCATTTFLCRIQIKGKIKPSATEDIYIPTLSMDGGV